MRRLAPTLALALIVAFSAAPTFADGTISKSEVARELGWMLSWRLGPGIVEEKCRDIDPSGSDVRAQALRGWQQKNAATLESIDARVAEVLTRLFPAANAQDSAKKLGDQIKTLFLEENFPSSKAEDSVTFCKAEADPAGSRWNSTGMPQVQESLAALYDWLVQQKAAKP